MSPPTQLVASLVAATEAAPDDAPLRLHLAEILRSLGQTVEAEAAVLAPMRNPELRRLSQKSRTGGVLLYGPPGCGKTFLARALAGELQARFSPSRSATSTRPRRSQRSRRSSGSPASGRPSSCFSTRSTRLGRRGPIGQRRGRRRAASSDSPPSSTAVRRATSG